MLNLSWPSYRVPPPYLFVATERAPQIERLAAKGRSGQALQGGIRLQFRLSVRQPPLIKTQFEPPLLSAPKVIAPPAPGHLSNAQPQNWWISERRDRTQPLIWRPFEGNESCHILMNASIDGDEPRVEVDIAHLADDQHLDTGYLLS